MKKIFFSLVALAAIAACSKSEVEYDNPAEIGFAPVSKLSTKAAVDGTNYPDALNMYIFANAGEPTAALTAGYSEPYLVNAEFTHTPQRTPSLTLSDNVFAGVTPYYWPNVKKLIFSGYSNSGNARTINPTYKWNTYINDQNVVRKLLENEELGSKTIHHQAWEIEMTGYEPGKGTAASATNPAGNNDLMWFPTTTTSYGKPTDDKWSVPVTMKHACAWVTINIKGDGVTGKSGTTWKIKNLSFTDLSQSGNVTLGTDAEWTSITNGDNFNVFNRTTAADYKQLTSQYVDYTQIDFKDLVIVPQPTKTLYITYEFVSQENLTPITETKPLALTYTDDAGWEAGKHYTYNITIGTKEILVNPTVKAWETGNVPPTEI